MNIKYLDQIMIRRAAQIIQLKNKNSIFRYMLTHNHSIGRPGPRAIEDTKAFPTKALYITHTS